MPAPFAIDLRSDTVTTPDAAMRRAMADAEVGDDVLEGDPTARRLELRVAELLGKQDGVLVSSGTQGNLVAQLAHGVHGRAILAGRTMHVEQWEAGGHAVVTGSPLALLDESVDGLPATDEVVARCAVTDDPHVARVGLAWSENTHGGLGGRPVTPGAVARFRAAVPAAVPLHTDGARLLDAAVALDTTAAELVADADSATLCLSKGLGCPVGTVLVGDRDFVVEARRARKLLGGAMRQVGIVAAAGLHVLDEGGLDATLQAIGRAHIDARTITDALVALPGVTDPYDVTAPFDESTTATNIVRFGVDPSVVAGGRDAVVDALDAADVGALRYGAGVRLVTHRRLADGDADHVAAVLGGILTS